MNEQTDVFDTRPVLTAVPAITCGFRLNGWICISKQHPASPHHYFVKESRA